MGILFVAENIKRPKHHYKNISVWLNQIILKYGHSTGDLTVIFCKDEYLRGINEKFLAHDYYTDIITFDYSVNKILSGDLFISVDRVLENSFLFKHSFSDELLRVIVHGLLHLIGFKDSMEEEKSIMRELENECLIMYQENV